jgi:hypothetical protein
VRGPAGRQPIGRVFSPSPRALRARVGRGSALAIALTRVRTETPLVRVAAGPDLVTALTRVRATEGARQASGPATVSWPLTSGGSAASCRSTTLPLGTWISTVRRVTTRPGLPSARRRPAPPHEVAKCNFDP